MSVWRVIRRTWLIQLRLRVAFPISYFQVLLQPLVFGGIGLPLYSAGGRSAHLAFAVIGGGLVGLWSVTLFNAGFDIQAERWAGTLEQLMGCPTPLAAVIVGKIASSLCLGLASLAANLAVGWVFFPHLFHRIDAIPFAISGALTLLAFFAISLVIAPLFAWTRTAGALANGMETPAYLLGGFMFPVAILAGWVQPLAGLFAPSWTVRALYAAAGESASRPDYPLWWGLGLAGTAVYLALSAGLFHLLETRARRSGRIGFA